MARLKVGVIGCGAIAQIQHLPHLRELSDEFEIAGLCDLSPKVLAVVGDEYGVPPLRRFGDYRDLIESDIDAVIVCSSGSHAAPTIAAARAGKHVLVEKPMATTANEAEAMVAAADAAGVVLMVAYPKQHELAYRYGRARIHEMADVRFIQVNHLHPNNRLHLGKFRVHAFDDLPRQARDEAEGDYVNAVAKTLGYPSPDQMPPSILLAYSTILGSMIHDIGNLHGVFGPPTAVQSTDVWAEGRGITTTLAYADHKRAVCTWVDLPELWDFRNTLEVYGSRERVLISFPTGFSKGLPCTVVVQGMDDTYAPWRKEFSWNDNPFKLELQHFGTCVRANKVPITDGRAAVLDIALVRDIILAYLNR